MDLGKLRRMARDGTIARAVKPARYSDVFPIDLQIDVDRGHAGGQVHLSWKMDIWSIDCPKLGSFVKTLLNWAGNGWDPYKTEIAVWFLDRPSRRAKVNLTQGDHKGSFTISPGDATDENSYFCAIPMGPTFEE